MNIKIILSLVITFFIFLSSYAQDISWGETFKNQHLKDKYEPLGISDGRVFVLLKKFNLNKTQYYIEIYDTDLKLEQSVEIGLKAKGQKRKDILQVEKVIWTGNFIVLLKSKFDKRAESITYYSQSYNTSTLQLGTEIELGFFSNWNRKKVLPTIRISEDKSKILVFRKLKLPKEEEDSYRITVINDSGELLWKRNVSFDHWLNCKVSSTKISNSGMVYALAGEYSSKTKVETIKLFQFQKNKKNPSYHNLDVHPSIRFLRLHIAISPSGSISVYSLNKSKCYYKELDASLSTIISKTEFNIDDYSEKIIFKPKPNKNTAEHLNSLLIPSEKTKPLENDLNYIRTLRIVFHENGTKTILGQYEKKNKTLTSTPRDNHKIYRYENWHYDIIAVNLDATGNVKWCNLLPKRQYSIDGNRRLGNVMITEGDNSIQIYYTDELVNFSEGTIAEGCTRIKKLETVKVEISSNGKTTKTSLISGEAKRQVLYAWRSKQLSDKVCFLYTIAPLNQLMALTQKTTFGLMKL